ncbi:MAG: hypothetical protein UR52_C0006G0014 [Candidatus Gottesmanbacteria bacterium GW2011_GWA1_34_13]|uniref:Ribbon-helix-helix protein CopG domain-containing protein n=1 Tax=Candidatus Gottesmanbacteria bacterium GW2011_GWA1_34_13 TaxID=1618434 RepID=A0A0G0ARH7_9BACT|nr:MAG: hypothetical protein UR52_C0006G0014 [Candidatus Gottesmanbacteria bacterium GW2011_GWA1_34_13]
MSTVNISLPKEQVSIIDKFVVSFGFANRSEFFRSLIRLVTRDPKLVKSAATFPWVSPPKSSVKEIMADFKKVGKYSPEFLKDLEEGLRDSQYFKK